MPQDTQPRAPSREVAAIDPTERAARMVDGIKSADPGLTTYDFRDLGAYVRFSDLMSKAADVLPPHLQDKPAMCLAVTMRAVQWGFDPFALAAETYQVKSGQPIAYMARVYMAVLRQNGINLRYRFEGEYRIGGGAAQGRNGGETSSRKATGDRRCIAYAVIDGEELTYETPKLDDITIKNSPLWHNEPDQQLCYYAARGWARRYRPELMMGARSDDEVAAGHFARDVTPSDERTTFAARALAARQAREQPPMIDEAPVADLRPQRTPEEQARIDTQVHEAKIVEEASAGSPDVPPHWTSYEPADFNPASKEFEEGVAAFKAGEPASACPYLQNSEQADDWLAGWHDQRRAG